MLVSISKKAVRQLMSDDEVMTGTFDIICREPHNHMTASSCLIQKPFVAKLLMQAFFRFNKVDSSMSNKVKCLQHHHDSQ